MWTGLMFYENNINEYKYIYNKNITKYRLALVTVVSNFF